MNRLCNRLMKVRSSDATDTSFASKVATITRPSGQGVIDLTQNQESGLVPEWLLLHPYGTGDDNDVFDMRVVGWRRAGAGTPGTPAVFLPTVLGQFTCTMSAAVGVAGAFMVATERFADTIINHATISTAMERYIGTDSGGAQTMGNILINSPENNLIASIEMRTKGCELIEVTFDMTTGDPAGANALYGLY